MDIPLSQKVRFHWPIRLVDILITSHKRDNKLKKICFGRKSRRPPGTISRSWRRNREIFTVSYSEESRRLNRDCVNRIIRDNMIVNGILAGNPETDGRQFVRYEGVLDGLCDIICYGLDSIEIAASVMDYIVNMHPFVDGNKRTALMTASRILTNSGFRLPDDSEATFLFVKEIATYNLGKEEIDSWLRGHVISSPSVSRRRTGNGS